MSREISKVLVAWIGKSDLKGFLQQEASDLGPILSTLNAQSFDEIHLLYTDDGSQLQDYLTFLKTSFSLIVKSHPAKLRSPTHYGDVYECADALLKTLVTETVDLNLLLSPGTPTMQAVWVLLGKTQYPATFWESSPQQGVKQVEVPFHLAAEYIPAADNLSSQQLQKLAQAEAPANAAFDDIITQNPHMLRLKQQASVLATREVPVLIYGESGTGKELFARAIHNASARSDHPFVALNCGAIPEELVDSVLFGHKKGAFTGAHADKQGVFEQAKGGTLFLDEFGELSPAVQVRLLRVLQDQTYTPVGGTKEQTTNVRIITATNRDLMKAVVDGSFREDLFYRIAVGVLHLPPLRERAGDLSILVQWQLTALYKKDPDLQHKKISVGAKNLILQHPWFGNMRELQSTLLRAVLWSIGEEIQAEDIQQALFQMPEKNPGLLGRDVSQGVDLQGLIDELVQYYIPKALHHAQDNKTKAAELLGLSNYQTLNNWIKKHHVK